MKRRTRFLYVAGTVAASAAIVAWGGVASAANHAATVGSPLPTPGDPTGTPMVLLHEFMGNLGNYDPGHQRRPNVVVDQSFAWITVDVRSVAIERG